MSKCTFKPNLQQQSVIPPSFTKKGMTAIHKHIERQKSARKLSRTKEDQQKKKPGSGKVWTGEVTKPETP